MDWLPADFRHKSPEGGDGLPNAPLVDMAVAAGADSDEVTDCIEHETYAGWVSDTTNAAGEDGVTGTPTIFVNDEKLPGFSPEQIRAAVDKDPNGTDSYSLHHPASHTGARKLPPRRAESATSACGICHFVGRLCE